METKFSINDIIWQPTWSSPRQILDIEKSNGEYFYVLKFKYGKKLISRSPVEAEDRFCRLFKEEDKNEFIKQLEGMVASLEEEREAIETIKNLISEVLGDEKSLCKNK